MGVGARGTGERKTTYLFNKENIVSFRIEQMKNGLMILVTVQFLPFELTSSHKFKSKESDF